MSQMVIYDDDEGGRLLARFLPHSGRLVLEARDGAPVAVAPDDLEDVTRRLYEEAGRTLPVMIGRPDLGGGRTWSCKGLAIEKTPGGGVRYSIGGSAEVFSPGGARQVAAASVALADLPDADAAGAAVDALTAAIEAAGCVSGDFRALAEKLIANGAEAGRG